MRIYVVFAFLFFLALPVFSQSPESQRFASLSDSMGDTIDKSTSKLADFDSRIKDNSDMRTYAAYLRRHEYLSSALKESEIKLEKYIRTNDRLNVINDERDKYEVLLQQLETTKSDYDNFVKSTR